MHRKFSKVFFTKFDSLRVLVRTAVTGPIEPNSGRVSLGSLGLVRCDRIHKAQDVTNENEHSRCSKCTRKRVA